ncbi:EF-hand domain pair [Babesia duncani]|uniref:EF-hand domain pair n=1 Tax=Babesia duncani TaxID=323732 RepID=A0AAD9UQS1_9APIC|nr:EF-hand domain pair [Babesia duncani]
MTKVACSKKRGIVWNKLLRLFGWLCLICICTIPRTYAYNKHVTKHAGNIDTSQIHDLKRVNEVVTKETDHKAIESKGDHVKGKNVKAQHDDSKSNPKPIPVINKTQKDTIKSNGLSLKENKEDERLTRDFLDIRTKILAKATSLGKKHQDAIVAVVIITCTFAIVILFIHGAIENKIEDSGDQFLKNAYNMCFKQIALICLINLVLWLFMQTRMATLIDSYISSQYSSIYYAANNIKSVTESVFEALLSICIILLLWYIIYVIYFQFVVRRIASWMAKVDNSDILTTSKEIEFLERSWMSYIFYRGVISKAQYLSSRFEFIENLSAIKNKNVELCGYYFMEYMRANILKLAVKMFRPPTEMFLLIMLLVTLFRKAFDFNGVLEVIVVCALFVFCTLSMIFFYLHISHIESQLYPRFLSQYLMYKHNMSSDNLVENQDNFILPAYKCSSSAEPCSHVDSFYNGLEATNNHENLFIFKSRGPVVAFKFFEVTTFSFLMLLSFWAYLVQQHRETWLKSYIWGNYMIACCFLCNAVLLPKLLYSIIIVTKTGMLIDVDMVEIVYESRKSENTKHAIELIDALNLDGAYAYIINRGDEEWRDLLVQLKTCPSGVQKHLDVIWCQLDAKKEGYISASKAMQFLSSQGIVTNPHKRAKKFLEAFMRTQWGKLNQQEFFLLGLVVKNLIIHPLKEEKMKLLFEQVYCIPWGSPYGITLESLQSIERHVSLYCMTTRAHTAWY